MIVLNEHVQKGGCMPKILDNPKFKMDLFNPVLYGESEIGKVYILGFKKK